MRVLITGAGGFVGRHLISELLQSGHEPLAMDVALDRRLPAAVPSFGGDLLNAEFLLRLVGRLRPEACVHLGGISFVPEGWHNPERMLAVNVLGTINLLEAFRKAAATARILVVTSAEVYGCQPRTGPLSEDELFAPDNPYAISKATADQMTLLYARHHGLATLTARPGNHIGPGQSTRFAVPSFASQLLRIARREAPAVIQVGNLESRRDFTDVRDVARAYRLLLERGQPGQAYNIASGRETSLQEVLDQLCAILGVQPTVARDPQRYRPLEPRPQISIAKIQAETQWQAALPLAESLRAILADLQQAPLSVP